MSGSTSAAGAAGAETKVKEDLSRMEGAYGAEMIGKLKQMNVLIVGLRGLGIEVAKNLVLAGPKSVTLVDEAITRIEDLGANFYLTEAHVGKKTRGEACTPFLAEMNPNVSVMHHKGQVNEAFLSNFSAVCFCDDSVPLPQLVKFNEFCRNYKTPRRIVSNGNDSKAAKGEDVARPIAFLVANLHGIAGSVFTDFGPTHGVFDIDGEPTRTLIVDHITNAEHGVVTIDGKRHLLRNGDHVHFEEVQGMSDDATAAFEAKVNEAQAKGMEPPEPVTFKQEDVVTDINQVHVIKSTKDPKKFQIGDTRKLGAYKTGGIANEIKVRTTLSYQSLADSILSPRFEGGFLDFSCMGMEQQYHMARVALFKFQEAHNRFPALHSSSDADIVVAMAKKLLAEAPKGGSLYIESIDEKVVRTYALYAQAELSPLAALFGGIVAQEITKQTGKYTPINQWLHMLVPFATDQVPESASPVNSRYDHQISIFGKAFHDKLISQKVFVVGCGALGCEYMKSVAMMGLGTGPGGRVVVTDDDKIELSNLSRQFLFRRKHVDTFKSKSAAEAAAVMNPAVATSLKAYQIRVEPKTEDIFNDKFWGSLDFVVNALDNNKARQYTDGKCVLFRKPLFESGTLGTKANTVICLPDKTPSYSEGAVAGEDQGIAQCTLRHFPSLDIHCIEWAREKFNELFVGGADATNSFLEDPDKFFAKVDGSPLEAPDTLRTVKKWLEAAKAPSFEQCMQIVFEEFTSSFRNAINDLKHMFPEDARATVDDPAHPGQKIDAGPFWHGHKRFPKTADFDPVNNELHLDFVYHGANILASVFNVPEIRDKGKVLEMAKALKAPEWVFSGNLNIDLDEDKKKEDEDEDEVKKEESPPTVPDEDKQDSDEITAWLKSLDRSSWKLLTPADFEKDDDRNHHIDFITALTNMRAWNYNIKAVTRHKCRMVSGRIIPAIATTTAMITGFIMVEVYKYIQGQPLEAFRAATANLATNTYCIESLPDPRRVKTGLDQETYMQVVAVPEGFTTWDTIIVKGTKSTTVGEFMEMLKKQHHGVTVDFLSTLSGQTVYNTAEFARKEFYAKRCTEPLLKVFTELAGPVFPADRTYILLDCTVETESGDSGVVPRLQFSWA